MHHVPSCNTSLVFAAQSVEAWPVLAPTVSKNLQKTFRVDTLFPGKLVPPQEHCSCRWSCFKHCIASAYNLNISKTTAPSCSLPTPPQLQSASIAQQRPATDFQKESSQPCQCPLFRRPDTVHKLCSAGSCFWLDQAKRLLQVDYQPLINIHAQCLLSNTVGP